MPRRFGFLLAVVASLSGSAPAGAQTLPLKVIGTGQLTASTTQGDLRGTVLDDRGQPLGGVVVSAVGATSIFAVSEADGGFVLRHLPAGAYLLRAHLRGYAPMRGKLVQINQPTQQAGVIALTRTVATGKSEQPKVLEAGLGTSGTAGEDAPPAAAEPDTHDHGEVAWRLRHARRSVLKEAEYEFGDTADADPFDSVTRVVGSPARLASALFADLALNGQINLLTRTNFERPEDLLSFEGGAPRGITYVSLSAPTRGGQWSMRGAMTQGDVSSWILSGAFVRQGDVAHRYEAGLSYGTQRYLGGNADAFTAVSEGARNVGAVYAYDHWTVSPRVTLAYGGKYARYDYLTDRGLFSPMAAVTLTPVPGDSLRIHAAASRREVAPGAEEFLPPSTGLWLPPERTFSPITRGAGLTPERVDHVEVSAEREWFGEVVIGVRAFRETVNDQIVTMFGVASTSSTTPSIGHYYVGSGGDVDATGWGVGVSRTIGESLRASVDYTYADALWAGSSPDQRRLRRLAASTVRSDSEVIHDLTASVESEVPTTATRVLVIYKVNSAFAVPGTSSDARASARFAVQVNQALPFMNFSNAQWEMLIAVRSLFSDDFRDGSVYDELLVVRPPKRFVGGLTVRF